MIEDRPHLRGDIAVSFVACALVGLIAACGGIAFNYFVIFANRLWLPDPMPLGFADLDEATALICLSLPILGGVIVGQLTRLLPDRRPHGPADAILAAHSVPAMLDQRSGLISAAMAATSLSFGASVGQYGPIVHLGAVLGSMSARLLRLPARLGEVMLGAGAAAAVSAVFIAPIGGLLFAHEVVLRHYALRTFAPVAVASVIGYVTTLLVFPHGMALPAPGGGLMHPASLLVLVVLGVAAGGVAVVYMRAIEIAGAIAKRVAVPASLKPVIAGLIVGVAAIKLPQLLGLGLATTNAALDGQLGGGMALLLVAAKILAVALCLGFGYYGGVFSPALFIGAAFGTAWAALLGPGLAPVLPEALSASALAIAGMAAVVSTVVGAPISTVIIVLELTGNYEMAIGTTVTIVFAHLVTHRFVGRSLFDRQLMARGLDLSTGRERIALARQPIAPWIEGDCVRVAPDAAAESVIRRLIDGEASAAFVVDRGGRYLGQLSLVNLLRAERRGDGTAKAGELLKPSEIRLTASTSLLEAIQLLGRFTGESAPVVGVDGETFLGVVREAAVLQAYQTISQAVRRLEA